LDLLRSPHSNITQDKINGNAGSLEEWENEPKIKANGQHCSGTKREGFFPVALFFKFPKNFHKFGGSPGEIV